MLYFLARYAVTSELGSEHIDNDEYGEILYRLKFMEELRTAVNFMRIVWHMDGIPGFHMFGAAGRREKRGDMVLSMPLYAKYAKLRLK